MGKNVVFLNPRTCGIYKNGGPRYKTDPATGKRTDEIDNEMAEHVKGFLAGHSVPGLTKVSPRQVFRNGIIVPRYYDQRWNDPFKALCSQHGWRSTTLGELEKQGIIVVRGGHGSPSNDQRLGHIPYIKVSDIRSLRVNVNPTNLVSHVVAKRFWKGDDSGLRAWDLVTPNRASSNIGEFAILLPGEEQVVITKEVFVIRMLSGVEAGWTPFYLFWALCLKAVRIQWQRVALMQTNREDCGKRYREIMIPEPPSPKAVAHPSTAFRDYFTTLASARENFLDCLSPSGLEYIASALSNGPANADNDDATEVE